MNLELAPGQHHVEKSFQQASPGVTNCSQVFLSVFFRPLNPTSPAGRKADFPVCQFAGLSSPATEGTCMEGARFPCAIPQHASRITLHYFIDVKEQRAPYILITGCQKSQLDPKIFRIPQFLFTINQLEPLLPAVSRDERRKTLTTSPDARPPHLFNQAFSGFL